MHVTVMAKGDTACPGTRNGAHRSTSHAGQVWKPCKQQQHRRGRRHGRRHSTRAAALKAKHHRRQHMGGDLCHSGRRRARHHTLTGLC